MCEECECVCKLIQVIGFLGLVGKEPDVARGLLVDTGASINVHGQNWFEQFTKNGPKTVEIVEFCNWRYCNWR